MSARRQLIRSVHVACRELGLDQDARRDLQLRLVHKDSLTDMTDVEITVIRDHLKELGWKPASKKRNWRPRHKRADVRKIYAIWTALKQSGVWREDGHASLDRFCERVVGVSNTEWLKTEDAEVVIEALKDMAARNGVEWDI